ncbi:HNH endonuclease [Silvimonas sp.]|uniref:HNH endonuclease n=1 Tax=Silvimonas sp. TaxID=2650811 RepID=UPI0028450878|nr:HNH endonuclease [Silvimonas sp.]MDR3428987.1 HNH endonuclease [Silvimonas sp.]
MAGLFLVVGDDGNLIDSRVSLVEEDGIRGLAFESGGGKSGDTRPPRNPEYAQGLELVLSRMKNLGVIKLRAYLASSNARELWPALDRRALKVEGEVAISLQNQEPTNLRLALGNAMAQFKAKPTKKSGNNTKRVLLYAELTDAQWESVVFGKSAHEPGALAQERFTPIPDGITAEHLAGAMRDLDQGVPHLFGPSTSYDVFSNGKAYPPKAVVGIGAAAILGFQLRPSDFGGGEETRCFQILRSNGFQVFPKQKPSDYPDEIAVTTASIDDSQSYFEGAGKQVVVNRYERDPAARKAAIKHYGAVCQVCGLDFMKTYGEIGKGFIHVHHVKSLASIGKTYKVDPVQDLRPVCPNCHAMLHKGVSEPREIDELKAIINKMSTK